MDRMEKHHALMKLRVIAMVGAAFAFSTAGGEDFKTLSGQEYQGVTVNRVEADGIVISTDDGITKLSFRDLSAEVRAKYGYSAEREQVAIADRQQQAMAAAQQRNREARYNLWVTEINRLRSEASAAPTSVVQSGGRVEQGEARKERLLRKAAALEADLRSLREIANLCEQGGSSDAEIERLIDATIKGTVYISMPSAAAMIAWGAPRKVNRTLTERSASEQWVYKNRYLYVEDGRVSSIQSED